MYEAKSIFDIRVGTMVVVKGADVFLEQGLSEVKGEVRSVDQSHGSFSFYCDATGQIESIGLSQGDVWIVD